MPIAIIIWHKLYLVYFYNAIETARHRIFILGVQHHVVVLYQTCLNYGHGAKGAPRGGGGGSHI